MPSKKWLRVVLVAVFAIPAPAFAGNYTIDAEHTYPSLEFSHMGISIWRGKFNKTTGNITLDLAAKTGSADITVDTASIDFGLDRMNEHALGAEWFNTAKFPTMSYKGTILFKGAEPVAVDGQLTLRGVTKPLKLKINSLKCIEHVFYKKEVCGADAQGELHRADFGMTKHSEGEAGKVYLRIQAEALKTD